MHTCMPLLVIAIMGYDWSLTKHCQLWLTEVTTTFKAKRLKAILLYIIVIACACCVCVECVYAMCACLLACVCVHVCVCVRAWVRTCVFMSQHKTHAQNS